MKTMICCFLCILSLVADLYADNPPSFDASFEVLLNLSNVVPDSSGVFLASAEKLVNSYGVDKIKSALKTVLIDPNKESQWLNAQQLAVSYGVDPNFLLTWARGATKNAHIFEKDKMRLRMRVVGHLRQYGDESDVRLLRELADRLPSNQAVQKAALMDSAELLEIHLQNAVQSRHSGGDSDVQVGGAKGLQQQMQNNSPEFKGPPLSQSEKPTSATPWIITVVVFIVVIMGVLLLPVKRQAK